MARKFDREALNIGNSKVKRAATAFERSNTIIHKNPTKGGSTKKLTADNVSFQDLLGY